MSNSYDIGGNVTKLVVSEISTTNDGSIDISEEGEVSQHIKNSAEQFYSASVLGRSSGALSATLIIPDGTTMRVVETVQSIVDKVDENSVTLECTSLNDKIPQVTVYWTSTAATPDTVFATASANSTFKSWRPVGGGVYSIAFDSTSNYTKAYVGGSFYNLGTLSLSANLRYGVVNLSAGPIIKQKGSSGSLETFGPTGSALSAVKSNTNFYGGLSGIRIDGTVTSVLNVSVGAANYLFVAGAIKGVTVGLTSCSLLSSTAAPITSAAQLLATVLIFDLNATISNFAAVTMQNYEYQIVGNTPSINAFPGATITCLEFDSDYNSLLIGSNTAAISYLHDTLWIRDPLSPTPERVNPSKGVCPTSHIARIMLSATAPSTSRVFDRLSADNGFCTTYVQHVPNYWYWNAVSSYDPNASYYLPFFEEIKQLYTRTLKYFKGIVYVGGLLARHNPWSNNRFLWGLMGVICQAKEAPNNGVVQNWGTENNIQDIEQYNWTDNFSFRGAAAANHVVNSIVIDYTPSEDINEKPKLATMYVGGEFNTINSYDTTTYIEKPSAAPYVCAFDLRPSLSSYPGDVTTPAVRLTNWSPAPNNFVYNIALDNDVLYAIGNFTTVAAANGSFSRSRCVALTKADESTVLKARVLDDWKADITGAGNPKDKLYPIPDTSPLSGLMIISEGMTKVNNVEAPYVARVIKYQQNLSDLNRSYVSWSMGCSNMANGSLLIDTGSVVSKYDMAERPYILNSLTFSPAELSAGLGSSVGKGDPMRFFLQRNSTTPTTSTYNDPRLYPKTRISIQIKNGTTYLSPTLKSTVSGFALYFETEENKVTAFHWGSAGTSEVKNLTSYVANLETSNTSEIPITGTVVNLGELSVAVNNDGGTTGVQMITGITQHLRKYTTMTYSSGVFTDDGGTGGYRLDVVQSTYRTSGIPSSAVGNYNRFHIVTGQPTTPGNNDPVRQQTYLGKAWIVGAKVDQTID